VALRRALQAPLEGLATIAPAIRVNPAERVHLTLHFLGHLPVPEVEALPARLSAIAGRHHQFEVMVSGVGAFPGLSRPQVLWAGIGGVEMPRLTALQADLGVGLHEAGLPVEERRFRPHLTLARIPRPLPAPARSALRGWAIRWSDVELGKLTVTRVQLMRSQLGAGPARYTTLASLALQ
jgi:RNA 2',3'-cyclic 3'-phosphodiesterase